VNRQCRVTLTDGRVVLGSFICYDYLVIHVHARMNVCVYACMPLHIYVCVYVCMYVYIYIYIYIYRPN
jgi:hypothetical protein